MILKSLSFNNFKSFSSNARNQTLNQLDILTLIYGENNSGKSNVLKFIETLLEYKFELEDSVLVGGQLLERKNISPFWRGKISNDAFLFHKNDRKVNIEFEAIFSFNVSEISKLNNYAILTKELDIKNDTFDLKINGYIRSLIDPYESELIVSSVFVNTKEIYSHNKGVYNYFQGATGTLKNDSVSFENLMGLFGGCILFLDHNRFLNVENESETITPLNPSSFKNWLHNLTLDPLKYSRYDEFLTFIKSNSISNSTSNVLKDFEPTFARKSGRIDVLLKSYSERLPIGSYGTGIMQLLLILSMIFESRAKIILIEELELNLSPKTQQLFLQILAKLIQDKKIDQVIFTSHSDALAKSKGLVVYEVQLSNAGVSSVRHLTAPAPAFFARISQVDRQMAKSVHRRGTKGSEWY